MSDFDGLILAGGRGRRLGAASKARLEIGGKSFSERAMSALAGAEKVVFVGPPEEAPSGAVPVQEDPPGSGPVAGIAAGVAELSNDCIFVLAVDYPLVRAPLVGSLVSDLETDGRILVDPEGRDQPLAGAYRRSSLENALNSLDSFDNESVARLVIDLSLDRVQGGAAAVDCDTRDDLVFLQRMADGERTGGSRA